MMEVSVHAVGKMKKEYLQEGVLDYSRRLTHYLSFSLHEVKESTRKGLKEEERRRIKEEEGRRILQGVCSTTYFIPLHEKGRYMTSKGLASSLKNIQAKEKERIVFAIGGPFGLSSEVMDRGDFILSLSPMTFPHEIARLLLVEQLYRACKIIAREPYHL